MTADQITAVAAVATFVVVGIGAFMTWKSVQADHERRRKQATIEYYSTIRADWRDVMADVDALIGRDVMTADEAKLLATADSEADPDQFKALIAIRSYLSTLEWIAAGTRAGVYDIGILRWLGAGHFIRAATRYGAYIEIVRTRTNRPKVYEHLEWLAGEYKRMNAPSPEDPSIRHS